jgi:hypothetical protein
LLVQDFQVAMRGEKDYIKINHCHVCVSKDF